MSTAAVLCPGPSLSSLDRCPPADVVLAVNAAGSLGWHDWHVTSRPSEHGRPINTMDDDLIRSLLPFKEVREMALWNPGYHPAGTAMLLGLQWCSVVRVYGDDREGLKRFDGSVRTRPGFVEDTAVFDRIKSFVGNRLQRVLP